MSDYITAAEATTILRDLARGREDGDGGDVWPLYDRAEDAMRQVIALDLAATRLESERAAERTRADAAEADRDALRAECERLRAIYEAVDEFLFCDYAAEVESYSETSPGSHAASQARASEAWNALVRLRDAERELRLATLPACASAPAGVVAVEAATRAVTGHAALAGAVRAYLDAADASRRITGESYDALDDGAIDDWRTRHGAASKAKVAARTALDAALLAATTTPEEGHG